MLGKGDPDILLKPGISLILNMNLSTFPEFTLIVKEVFSVSMMLSSVTVSYKVNRQSRGKFSYFEADSV